VGACLLRLERWETMDDRVFLAELVADQYGRVPSDCRLLPSSIPGKRYVAQLRFPDGQQWQIKARHQTLTPLGPPADLARWLHARAAVLARLAERQYPAPRVVSTSANTPVGHFAGWYSLATTWIDGTLTDLTPPYAHRAGQALGDLHRLTADGIADLPAAHYAAWWHPIHVLPEALASLAAAAPLIPAEWTAFHRACVATLSAMTTWSSLPTAIVHADCWAGNLVQTPDAQSIAIDWDTAGVGPAVLDLGELLSGCLVPLDDPYRADVRVDRDRVRAVAAGYCTRRQPGAEELAVLLDAVRYGAVFRGTRVFGRVVAEGWTSAIVGELERQATRSTNSAEVALTARSVFEQR
jgi:Ser/Thr protein kinase RdoA (MazF antagonist)